MNSNSRVANTGERLRQIMQLRGLRQSDIVAAAVPYAEKYSVRLGKNDLNAYIHERYLPAQDKLAILAMALDVSEAWLMGYDVPMERTYNSFAPSIPWSERFRNAVYAKVSETDPADLDAAQISPREIDSLIAPEKRVSFDQACELADCLGISLDDEVLERDAPAQQDERTSEVIRLFGSLDQERQETLVQVLRGLLADQAARSGGQGKAD